MTDIPDVRLHRAIGTDEWLVAMPDFRGELVVVIARERELKSYRKLQKVILEKETRVIGRAQWRALHEALTLRRN
jgi:hypothetical protein